MKTRIFFTILFALMFFAGQSISAENDKGKDLVLQHVRNATIKLTSGDTTFLIDPMLAETGAYEGFPNSYRSYLRNPLTPLPMPVKDVLEGVDAVILTHTHLDHWDKAAQDALPKNIPFYVQNEEDAKIVRGQGFSNVRIMKPSDEFGGIKLERAATQHGTNAMYADPVLGKLLGDVMGVVFTTRNGKRAYLAGDTIWFKGVDDALAKHKPDIIILNSGGASVDMEKFKESSEIIMGKDDVLKMAKVMPNSNIVAVHMDAINHMTVDRKDLAEFVRENGIGDKVLIPFDGEKITFGN